MNNNQLESLARKLKALAEPKRLEIIDLLKQGVQCNCNLGGKLNMAPNLISHHLRVLAQAGFITTERDQTDARWIYYSLNTEMLEEFSTEIGMLMDTSEIQPRNSCCGPSRKAIGVEYPVSD
ncbi:MAG: metalloregulator ArsR/SmtB family transcription factor [Chloroflexi bacterium]|nr:metalloregulator ArsR/SmtB family transcription factor [Chloroflexota bacterium]